MSVLLRVVPAREICLMCTSNQFRRSLCNGIPANLKPPVTKNFFKVETILNDMRHQQVIDFIFNNSYPRSSERKPTAIGQGILSLIDEVPYLLDERVSLMALDSRNDRVIGVAINSNSSLNTESLDRPSPNIGVKAYRSCLKQLQMDSNIVEKRKEKQGLDLVYLGVKECFERRGIARNLAEQSIQLAQQRKLHYIQSITFCPDTWNIFKSLEFETLKKYKLMDHWIEGVKAFPNAGPDDFVYLEMKML
jgi:ribosomal protein S18 acetylase RimI-like enzyme